MSDVRPAPVLETGWLPATPPGDTYLRRFLFNWSGMCAATARSVGGNAEALPAMHLADSGRPAAFANCATLLQPLSAESVTDTLEMIASFFAFDDPSRVGEVLLVSAWPTGDLRPFGWNLMGHPPIHLRPRGGDSLPPPTDLNIEEVRDLEDLYAWERVAIEGYPFEALIDAPSGSIVSASWLNEPRCRLWVGRVENRAVCASSAWTEYGINDVTLVATLPDARRRGYGEALTWRAALADATLPAMLLSSDDGRPIYERMGFLPLMRLTLWYRGRPG